MVDEARRLTVRIDEQYADAQAIEELTLGLRSELRALDAEASRAGGGAAPPGTRALELVALGTILVTLAQSDVLAAIINAVNDWANRNSRRSVRIELDGDVLEVSGAAKADQKRLTDEWLARRSPSRAPSAGSRHALIVAGYEFQDPGLRRLRAPAHDAEALSDVLGNPAIGDFQVRTLLNESAPVVNEAIEEFFADRKPDDLLLLHFSGHGVKDEEGELYFATAPTKLNRLGATAVSADFVNKRMNRSRSRRIVLLLDCCYAGAFGRGMVPRAGKQMDIQGHFGGRGRAVITASNASEYAFEGADLADSDPTPSVFTSALVDGLRTGDADADQDGYVGLDELYEYVYDKVRRATPNQTPGKWTFDLQGDLQIARRGRPVTRPSTLPAELQAALDHPLAGVRAGAVTELARLLEARHHGLALAAKLALERLSDDDSRDVSSRAAAALAVPVAVASPVAAATPAIAEPKSRLNAEAAAPVVQQAERAAAPAAGAAPGAEAAVPKDEAVTPKAAPPKAEPSVVQQRKPEPVAAAEPAQHVPFWRRFAAVGGLAWAAILALQFDVASRSGLLPTILTGFLRPRGLGLTLFFVWMLLPALVLLAVARPQQRLRRVGEGASFGLAAGLLGMIYIDSEIDGLVWNLPLTLIIVAAFLGLAAVLVDPIRTEPSGPLRMLGFAAVLVAAALTVYCVAPRSSRVDVPDPVGLIVGIPVIVVALLYLVAAFLRWRSRQIPIPIAALGAAATLPLAGVILLIHEQNRPALAAYMIVAVVLFAAAIVVPERSFGRLLALRLGALLSLLAVNRIVQHFLPVGDHGIADLILLAMVAAAVGTSILAARTARPSAAGR